MVRARKPGSGGARVGAPQTAYANRSDLSQAIKTAPGQPYGVAQQQAQAQKAIPLPTQAAQPAISGGGGVPSPGGQPQPPPPPAVMPGSFGDFHRPTERPNEPVTAGLPTGPGPGPEALQQTQGPNVLAQGAALLNLLGPNVDNDTKQLRNYINATLSNQGPPG